MEKKVISTKNAPGAIGPYSQGIIANDFVFTAGQISLDPQSGNVVGTDVQTQTRQVLANLKAVLEAGRSGLAHVVKATVYLKDMNDFAAMNEVYAEFFGKSLPARAAVEVARLPKDVLVEIDAIAVVVS